jgi:polyferredoxin
MAELFPWGKWTCFSFILFWPLSCWQFGTSTFWTIFPFIQTGLFLYWIVKEYGKGAYCGWICSCGGMAETLGDEYRSLAPHGPKAKSLENLGQFVLAFAFVVTALSYMSHQEILPKGVWLDTLKGSYKFSIDVFFAGVLGLGVYFFMGGRVWCRFGCPLAALMHIYTRFSKYRILSEKKSCISCNICTKVCHMGIDVMNYANKGIPMNDVECVRCSTCVTSCPMEVLSFEKMMESDPDNKARPSVPDYGKDDWRAGIK